MKLNEILLNKNIKLSDKDIEKIDIKDITIAISKAKSEDEKKMLNDLLIRKNKLLICDEALSILDEWEKNVK